MPRGFSVFGFTPQAAQTGISRLGRLFATLCWLGLWTGCASSPDSVTSSAKVPPEPQVPQAELGRWGVETQYISPTLKPGDDFYRYVNQGWLETKEIPSGLSRYSSFNALALQAEAQIKAILAELRTQPAERGTPGQQLVEFYTSYTNVNLRNLLDLTMFQQDISNILAARDANGVASIMGRAGYPSVFATEITLDPQSPREYRVAVEQGGLGLPGRDYYLKTAAPYPAHRAKYRDYIAFLLKKVGFSQPMAKANRVLAFETALAEQQWPPERQREILEMYNVMSLAELRDYAPGFAWTRYFRSGSIPEQDKIIVGTDTAVQATARLFAQTDLDTLKCYTIAHLLNRYAEFLSEEVEAQHFDLYSRTLNGIDQPRPLDVRAVKVVNTYLGEPLGKLYVERHFPATHKQQMEELVGYVRQAFKERLKSNAWMDDLTRAESHFKLAAFNTKIGYPEQWHDYSSVEISKLDLVGNVRAVEYWMHQNALKRLQQGRREWEWSMTPQTVNAYYSASRNEIVFPAAILQPPFFDPKADPAVNFGAIGMVIGHELGHGFDDQGSRFDGSGALRDWWSEQARGKFDALAGQLVTQFSGYSPLSGVKVNGQLTLGENIGDLGGLSIAWSAWQAYKKANYKDGEPPVLGGYTGDQRFFLSYAQMWRSLYKPEALRWQLTSDPHSPAEYRVNGVVRNFDAWYEAFGVLEDATLFLPGDARVRIW